MKTLICSKPGELALIEQTPPTRAAGEILLRVRRVGLCGTDFHIFTGHQPYLDYPRVPGHELAATVGEADAGSAFKPGQLVTVNPYLACGNCHACGLGKPNCCMNIGVLGVHRDGGMSELISVPQDAVIAVDGLTPEQAAMVEFLAVGRHAVCRGDVAGGERVLVAGAGPIGIGIALFAAEAGAEVTLIDTETERLDHARQAIGIPHTLLADDALDEILARETDGNFFDAVFDATGNRSAMERGFSFVAHGGRYVLVSIVKGDISFTDSEFHKREMTLIASRNALSQDFEHVIAAMRAGKIPTAALNTHNFALDDLAEHMPALIRDRGSIVKAIGHFA